MGDGMPWRYRCPEGHAALEGLGTGETYYCDSCGCSYSGAPVDLKHGGSQ